MPIRTLIVDDSRLVRQLLSEILVRDAAIEVVGTAHDVSVAREAIERVKPDVLTLGVELPFMRALTFLDHPMRRQPLPAMMVSSLTALGAGATLEALALGAVDFVPKPRLDAKRCLNAYADALIAKIKAVSLAKAPARRRTAAFGNAR